MLCRSCENALVEIIRDYIAVEQGSNVSGERKFKLYYRFPEGGFITYIITIDGHIRLITVYRTSKSLQKKVYKYRKRG